MLGEYRRLSDAPDGAAASSASDAPRLTERETEVLRLVAKGLSYKQIAERLVLSHRTVQNHVQNTLRKLQMHNRVQLVRYAIEQGLDDSAVATAGLYPRGVADDSLLSIAEELYSLLPAEFTGTRNQWAKQTKADGDAELATQVSGLRKPSVAAWVVNMMMRHQGEQMTQVLELGASLRQAQADLDGEALRELTRQRRQLTTAVTRQGRELAGELGTRITETVADQVQGTLHAAMIDEDAAAAVRSGLLVSALEATGVGAADVVDAVAVPAAIGMTPRAAPMPERKRADLSVVPEPERAPEDEEKQRAADERRALQAAVDQAVAAADEARKRVRKAGKRVEKVQARTLQAAEELEEARGRVAELEHELETLDGEVREGRGEVAEGRAEVRRGAGGARGSPLPALIQP